MWLQRVVLVGEREANWVDVDVVVNGMVTNVSRSAVAIVDNAMLRSFLI